jgi:hypothetical protein
MNAMQYATIFEHGRQLRLSDDLFAPSIGAGWTPGSVSAAINGPAAMCSSKCGEVPSTV